MRAPDRRAAALGTLALLLAASCVPMPGVGRATALKDAFRGAFLVGAAVSAAQFTERDVAGARLVKRQYNTISPENVLKWERVHPRPGVYEFAAADRYVDFGERNGMFVIGHTLVWHSQTPAWVFEDSAGRPLGRDSLLARMRDHIFTVVGRYRGRVAGWDVVNEALAADGTLRDSPWRRIIGDDYIAAAFRFAHEADPAAELYYNDFSLEDAPKRRGAVRLIQTLRAEGVPITAIGMQEHNKMLWPTAAAVDTTIRMFSATGVHVNVTELDVDVLPDVVGHTADVAQSAGAPPWANPYRRGLPRQVQHALADRYRELFQVYWQHRDVIDRVTFWGVSDGDSWLNNWPARGRTSYPLLFDRRHRPKPAFGAVVRVTR